MTDEVKIYMHLAGILYKEKSEFQTFLHIVETQDHDLLLVATIATNSLQLPKQRVKVQSKRLHHSQKLYRC
jgi:hypothetical protein